MRFYRKNKLHSSFTVDEAWLERRFRRSYYAQLITPVPIDLALRAFLSTIFEDETVVWNDDEAFRRLLMRVAPLKPELTLIQEQMTDAMQTEDERYEDALNPWRDRD
jgi:hypothetical protein